jgi:regulator of sigma E protease
MTQLFFYIVPVAVILGFMIFIHELGHFLVAKALGVRVEQFAIGFGTRLIGFRKGETDYRINAIPLGGYVKMSGENPMDDRTGDPGEFMSHSRWHRFLIAIAGPTMNILLAIVLLTIVYRVHYEYPASKDRPAVIGWVEQDSPAAKIGALPGDRITQIADVQDPTWGDVMSKDMLNPNQPLNIVIQRGSQRLEKQIVPEAVTVNQVGSAGWHPDEPVIVGILESGMPAEKAGIQVDDKIVAMDGQPVTSIEAMIQSLQQTKDKPVNFTIVRGSQTLNLTIQPVLAAASGTPQNRDDWFDRLLRRLGFGNSPARKPEDHYRIGFSYSPEMKVGSLPLTEAFRRSLSDNRTNSLLLLDLVGKLVQGKISPKTISGPIGIAQVAGDAAQEKGWTPLIEITSMISLNLGIFNLLPFPIMDGGVILLLFIEAVMRRDISLQIKERIYQAAFVFLVLFATMVIYNDIAKTIAERLP